MDELAVHFDDNVPVHVYQAELEGKRVDLQVRLCSQVSRPQNTFSRSQAHKQLFAKSSYGAASKQDAEPSQIFQQCLKSKATLYLRITDATDLYFMCYTYLCTYFTI